MELEKKSLAIKKALHIGGDLVKAFPLIGNLYREGMSKPEIASFLVYEHPELIGDYFPRQFSWSILENGVGFALRGNPRKYLGILPYAGLIPIEEVGVIGKQNQRRCLADAIRTGANMSGLKVFTSGQLRELSKQGAKARGFVPWSLEELDFLRTYALGCNGDRPDWVYVANHLNTKFHKNKPVRNRSRVSNAVRRYTLHRHSVSE